MKEKIVVLHEETLAIVISLMHTIHGSPRGFQKTPGLYRAQLQNFCSKNHLSKILNSRVLSYLLPIDTPFNICGWHVAGLPNEKLIKKLEDD